MEPETTQKTGRYRKAIRVGNQIQKHMKKRKMKFLLIMVLFCSSILFYSCENNSYEIQLPQKVDGSLNILEQDLFEVIENGSRLIYEFEVSSKNELIKFESSIVDNQLHSSLSYKYEESEWIGLSSFCVDLLDKDYKKGMNLVVAEQGNFLKRQYDYPKIERIANILDGLPELLFRKLGKEEYFNESTLSVFYHLAAFNAAKRAHETKSEKCQCSIYNSYVNNESPFFCAEDKIVSVDKAYDFVKKISDNRRFAGKQFNPKTLLHYLENESGKFVSVSKIDKIFKDEAKYFWDKELTREERIKVYNQNNTLSMVSRLKSANSETYDGWPVDPSCFLFGVSAGSDCGCCGNYSGPCWTCSLACYLHDLSCETCEPSWYCFSGCVPSPC